MCLILYITIRSKEIKGTKKIMLYGLGRNYRQFHLFSFEDIRINAR